MSEWNFMWDNITGGAFFNFLTAIFSRLMYVENLIKGVKKQAIHRDANPYEFIHIHSNFYTKYVSTNLSTK